ncbi:hypothetical protein BG015_000521 [Linnemannia schmuckeri]|uniref:F-box domain-containing protein n=1 Tax=Linnemannia schmuckeri TaxID=64567 RepID=A0A9P5V7P8_9FUNG|nr:hypothetical protein BG015_000521 [Linnemannia schmuckeri]
MSTASPKNIETPHRIPEILEAIGSHLDFAPLLNCSMVCKTWHSAFVPLLWYTVIEYDPFWRKLLVWSEVNLKEEEKHHLRERCRSLVRKYGHHIRELVLCSESLIPMFLSTTGDGPLKTLATTQLRSFILYQPTHWIGGDELPEPIPSLFGLYTIQHHHRSPIPLLDYENLDVVPFWELVRDNPGLQCLEVRSTLPCDHSSLPNCQITPVRTFDSLAGQAFVRTTLENMAELQTLQLHLCYDTFPFRTLTNLSRITEMTIPKYGELHDHDLDGVHSDTLRRLDIKAFINAGLIPSILQAFPNLQELIAMDNNIYDGSSVTDQRMVHSRLETIRLSADGLVGLPISLPSLKRLHLVETNPHHLDFLGDLLDQFPSLEHLDATLWSLTIERALDVTETAGTKNSTKTEPALTSLIAKIKGGYDGMSWSPIPFLRRMPRLTRLQIEGQLIPIPQ